MSNRKNARKKIIVIYAGPSGVVVSCSICGQRKRIIRAEALRNKSGHFCSTIDCKSEFVRRSQKGRVSSKRNFLIGIHCARCGAEVDPQRAGVARRKGHANTFCSHECYGQYRTGRSIKGMILLPSISGKRCAYCAKVLSGDYVRQNKFCNHECFALSRKLITGASHPSWRGGTRAFRGHKWKTQRLAAIERDKGTCQKCGKKMGAKIDVHHIRRYSLFEKSDDANVLENLVCLCRSCHRLVEAETDDGHIGNWAAVYAERVSRPKKRLEITMKTLGPEIRKRHAAGEQRKDLAAEYGLSHHYMHCIFNGKRLKYEKRYNSERSTLLQKQRIIAEKKASQIRREYHSGSLSKRLLAVKYNLTRHRIQVILFGKTWRGRT